MDERRFKSVMVALTGIQMGGPLDAATVTNIIEMWH